MTTINRHRASYTRQEHLFGNVTRNTCIVLEGDNKPKVTESCDGLIVIVDLKVEATWRALTASRMLTSSLVLCGTFLPRLVTGSLKSVSANNAMLNAVAKSVRN